MYIGAFFAALLLTGFFRRYAISGLLMDVPNERSAHGAPTPRGGGLAFVLAFSLTLPILVAMDFVTLPAAVGVGGAALIVALIGLIDDHGHVPARWRLLVHFAGAVWLLAWLWFPSASYLFGLKIPHLALYSGAIVLIVWLINLYNFMDGIDGIASTEAITCGLGGALVAGLAGHSDLVAIHVSIASAVAGFLVWNWPPALIFMGDVGSGFLGVVLAGLMLLASTEDANLAFCWLILLGVFIVDSGVTLCRRAIRGERIYEAHRSHAYQHAAQAFGSHERVTLCVLLTNMFWLTPLAAVVAMDWVPGAVGVVIAYIPLLFGTARFRAGIPVQIARPTDRRSAGG